MGNVPDFVIGLALTLAAGGLVVGFLMGRATAPVTVIVAGLIIAAPLAYSVVQMRAGGCAGGECGGAVFLLFIFALPAFVGAGMVAAGILMALKRALLRRS